MLKALFDSKDKELVLQYLLSKQESYASKIVRFYNLKPSQILKQLEALEEGDVLVGSQARRTRLYKFNPRYHYHWRDECSLEQAILVASKHKVDFESIKLFNAR